MDNGSNLWIEKYRPLDFKDVKGQDSIVQRVEAMVKSKNLQHMIFSGYPGTGKSSLALVVAKQLFGENWRDNFLELNSSDARGIDTIRNDVKDFAKTISIGSDIPRIIFLDEADALTRDAQNALRRTMETYSKTARFILSCNYSSQIIDAISSRCVVFRFKKLDKKDMVKIIEKISKEESLKVNDKVIDLLYEVSEGDVRRLENVLQSCATINKTITEDLIHQVISFAEPKEIKNVLELSILGKFVDARKKLLDIMMKYGLSGSDIIKQIQKEVLNLNIDENRKLKMVEKCGEVEFRLVEGSDEFIQLEALLASFALIK
ncbi:replication factor C small subunit [archaeon]|nr:replication factor C small subunit [archaeon]|tara:strand:+ start:281 stop:1237 length:957 start_codon:yes stop_codon:yes gene_type:complete